MHGRSFCRCSWQLVFRPATSIGARATGEGVVITAGASIPAVWRFAGPEHACVGMGIVVGGVPCYFDCANEAGLAIAGLNFPGYAQFAEAPEKGAVNVAAYEFPLWVAASFSTVAEVRKALKDVVIVAKRPARAMAWPSCTGW